jgi:Rps23 Pro-64 3,4-dihydroxylase Tpa1-like proline 4-hydroxylase
MLDLTRITSRTLETEPYSWAMIDNLYTPENAALLAETYPRDHFKTLSGKDAEKEYLYDARSLLGLGADTVSYPEELSAAWRELAHDLLSPEYRAAMSQLTGYDLTAAPVEANVYHYGPGSCLGPHLDMPIKLVTHVLYFNAEWDLKDGGNLTILRSKNEDDVASVIPPIVGSSAVLVRSERSWHAVQRVVESCRRSRRCVTITFYSPGSVSPMWPPGDATPLHRYEEPYGDGKPGLLGWARRLLSR